MNTESRLDSKPAPARAPYEAPRLAKYGSVRDLTLTVSVSMNKNDAIQGGQNLKT